MALGEEFDRARRWNMRTRRLLAGIGAVIAVLGFVLAPFLAQTASANPDPPPKPRCPVEECR